MIAAVSPVSGGELRILGMDPAIDGPAIRGRLGVCPQEDTLDTELNVRDNLYIYGRYFGIPKAEVSERADELLEFVQLTDKAKSKVDDLSGGMKRRLTIARSLINRPDLLLLDEPTTGLDPQARHVLWDRLFRLKQPGVTLVITTHYMDEAEQLCDRLVVMDKGVIVAEGSPLELIRAALHARGGRAAVRGGRRGRDPRRARREGRRPRRPGRGAARPAARLQRRRRRGDRPGARARAPARSRRWCAAAPSRTSSSASPAGRWWTEEARRGCDGLDRLDQRAAALGDGVRRQVDYWTTVYKRTWRAR